MTNLTDWIGALGVSLIHLAYLLNVLKIVSTDRLVCILLNLVGASLATLASVLIDYKPFVAAWITLRVHSSLEAVGLTARFAEALTQAGISCNVVAAYYNDHIFVPSHQAEKALSALQKLK